ncbi:MAG: NAD(P)H-binding protein [Thermodesulfovibrionales bacterium]
MEDLALGPEDRVLVLGGTGFVGRRLLPRLLEKGARLRLLARSPEKARAVAPAGVEVIKGDLSSGEGLGEALEGIHTAYYLVHSLGGKSLFRNLEFAREEMLHAQNFVEEAGAAGLRRVIYLGALGEAGPELSEHLRIKAEVGEALSAGPASCTTLRAAIIIGAGGASFEMLRYLVERLPVMVCPRWIETRIQPIAIGDVIEYLAGCLYDPRTAGRAFDICGPEVFTYREMMERYAEARGLARRLIFRVPFLTPLLSAYWVDLVTPVPSGTAHPLIEGLKNDVVCRENSIEAFIRIEKTPFREAVLEAVSEERDGPGVRGF